MAIKKIRISNFKNFRDLEIELGNFNVLIGTNASGKSNFIEIFKFLRDIPIWGLDNAISLQGGIEYFRNMNIGDSENFSLEVVSNRELKILGPKTKKEKPTGIDIYEIVYNFTIGFQEGDKFKIIQDKLIYKGEFIRLEKKKGEFDEKEMLGKGEIVFCKVDGEVDVDLKLPKGVTIKETDMLSPFLSEERLKSKILLEYPYFMGMLPLSSETSIYDFNPKLPKVATSIIGIAILEENGRNLTRILKNILEDKEEERKFFNLVKSILSFVDHLDIEMFPDKFLLFKLQEIYDKRHYIPAPLISDGTINIIALIVALYFQKNEVAIIEEPERNIHSYLISRVVEMMKEASQKKQIIVTTHNPEMVKYAGLENLLLISRDKEGFSAISRPYEKKEIKIFLENEMGIEELYVQNLLGAY